MRGFVVCVVGPTAVGKSAFAEKLACSFNSRLISVDAMQVYRGMDIGTAKTPLAERSVELAMVDVCDVDQNYSVELFQKDARRCVDHDLSLGRLPILVGGTGLYLDAVIDCMDFVKGDRTSETRLHYEQLAHDLGEQGIYQLLLERDPQAAALIHPHNVRRVIRALEMCDAGISYAEQSAGLHEHEPYYEPYIVGLSMEREQLYARINERVDLMMEQGLLDEVQTLAGKGLRNNKTAGQAIGYKELLAYLEHELSLDDAIELIKQRSRRYAKRQLSWFGRDPRVEWHDVANEDMLELINLCHERIFQLQER